VKQHNGTSDTTRSRSFDVQILREQLQTQIIGVGKHLVFVPIVDSTNTLAMQLARQEFAEKTDDMEGTVVLTDSQTAGKGRLGRQWVDVEGKNVLSSTILYPHFAAPLLVMMAALSVVEAIGQTCGITATIKWPNDVLIDDQKVAGILIEVTRDRNGRTFAVVGIGVNINGQRNMLAEMTQEVHNTPQTSTIRARGNTPYKATTLEMQCGHEVSREQFVAHLLRSLETHYFALQQEVSNPEITLDARLAATTFYQPASRLVREQWHSQLSTLGRSIEVRQGDTILSGVAEDVDHNGELLLRCDSGERVTITWGDVGYPTA